MLNFLDKSISYFNESIKIQLCLCFSLFIDGFHFQVCFTFFFSFLLLTFYSFLSFLKIYCQIFINFLSWQNYFNNKKICRYLDDLISVNSFLYQWLYFQFNSYSKSLRKTFSQIFATVITFLSFPNHPKLLQH